MSRPNPRAYAAELHGSSWAVGPVGEFGTITAARRWAEDFGTTADGCTIRDRAGRIVAVHRRDPNGDGTRWYRAAAPYDARDWIEERDPYPIPE